jgi:AraC family ethanolamine operon transcriptional activator
MLAGRRSHLDGLHVFSGRDGFEYLSPATHLVVNIQFYPARLGHPALRDAVGRMAEQLGSQASVLDMEPAHMARLRQTLVTLLSSVAQTPDLLASPPVREAVERTLVHAVLDVLQADQADGDSAAPAPSRARSWQLVRAVRERMERAAQDCPLSVAELGDNLGVSRRTLQYAFQDALGMSPTTYLRAARLNRVRSALPDATSVTEAATRFGFWHFGHFSTEYRALFKERPSDTVRRCKAPPPQTPQAPSDGTWVSGDWLS